MAAMIACALGASSSRVGEWISFELRRSGSPPVFLKATVLAIEGAQRRVELRVGAEPLVRQPMGRVEVVTGTSFPALSDFVGRFLVSAGMFPPVEVMPPRPDVSWARKRKRARSFGPPDISIETEHRLTAVGPLRTRRFDLSRGGITVMRIWLCESLPVVPLARIEVTGTGTSMEIRAVGRVQTTDSAPALEVYDGSSGTIR